MVIKVSDIKPGDKFILMGLDMVVTEILVTGKIYYITLEHYYPVNNFYYASITTKFIFSSDTWIEKAP